MQSLLLFIAEINAINLSRVNSGQTRADYDINANEGFSCQFPLLLCIMVTTVSVTSLQNRAYTAYRELTPIDEARVSCLSLPNPTTG
jgi:hypothetical protein